MAFQVACAQFAPQKANVPLNLDRIAEIALQASENGVDLVAFPETATSGYYLEGGVLECALSVEALGEALQTRLQGRLQHPLDLALGFYERANGHVYNSAAYFEIDTGCNLRGLHRKFFLPTYGVFDEERFVSRGRELRAFDTRFGKVAFLICEDAWHSISGTIYALQGATLFLVPSASPGRGFSGPQIGNVERYHRLMTALCEEHGVFAMNPQLCGFEGGKGMVGGSVVVAPSGAKLAESPIAEEHLLIATLDPDLVPITRQQLPLLADLQSAWGDLSNLLNGL